MTYQDFLQKRKERYLEIIEKKLYGKLCGLTGVELNLTELCNRKCSFCPRSNPLVYPNRRRFMSLKTVKKIVHDLYECDYKGDIYLCGFGEPLLHPEIFNIINIIKKKLSSCYIEITTNGDFVDMNFINKIKNKIDNLVINCYDGEHQVPLITKLAEDCNFKKFTIKKMWSPEIEKQYIQENILNNRGGIVNVIKKTTFSQRPCYLPFYKTFFDWTGDMLLCCNDWQRKQKGLGNINTNSFYDLWNSLAISKIRHNLKNGKRIDMACTDCNACGNLIGEQSVNLML